MIACKFLLLPLLVVSCGAFEYKDDKESVNKVVQTNNQLAIDLHAKMSSGDDNVFFSPFSISTVLGMLFYGAKGSTASEMRRVLGYTDSQLTDQEVHSAFRHIINLYGATSEEYELYVANALLAQNDFPIREEYKTVLGKMYHAEARDVDFAKEGSKVVEEINEWAKKATHGQITDFVKEIDPATVLFLLNAVYFKGIWKTQFDPKKTVTDVFYNKGLKDSNVAISFMKLKDKFPYLALGGVKALELPYKGEDISMVILLPDEMNGLSRLEQELKPNMIRDIRRLMKEREINVILPKFKLEYETTLNNVLKEIGLRKIFEDDADLSGISKTGNLVVSKASHKAVIEVNEEGSEASAITGLEIENRMGRIDIDFKVDHPFLFAIVDKRNDMILFHGRVNQM